MLFLCHMLSRDHVIKGSYNNHLVKFDCYSILGSRDISIFICPMTTYDHVIKGWNDAVGSDSLSWATILSSVWCMYVNVCLCLYICIYIYVCICIYVYIYIYILFYCNLLYFIVNYCFSLLFVWHFFSFFSFLIGRH